MRTVTPGQLAQLQGNPKNVRNICILAHVDHGKTTLADVLVASNGVISKRLAGKLRYLDSRADEQIRGITMKSSAISLQFQKESEDYLVNLIDSPGHVDFSSEVSTAVRLCDGAVVVVDVVEGVCPQTHAVLRQAWLENIKPVLVLNKVDRLITELKNSPMEAHLVLQQVLEQVNSVMGNLFSTDVMKKGTTEDCSSDVKEPATEDHVFDYSLELDHTDDSNLYFSPEQGNIVFASAIDGWGFRLEHFAKQYASKLNIKEEILQKVLWGDFYVHSKTKRVMKGAQAKGKKPLFVQFVLENVWAVYDAVLVRRDKEKVEKIVKSLNVTLSARDARHNDPRVLLQAVCGQWLPLSEAVLAMTVDQLPSPLQISPEKVEHLMCQTAQRFDSLPQPTQKLKEDFLMCSAEDSAPVIVFISKMFSVDSKALPHNRPRPLTQEEIEQKRELARQRHQEKLAALSNQTLVPQQEQAAEENGNDTCSTTILTNKKDKVDDDANVFVGFARVFSGKVRKGQKVFVLGPKHSPSHALQHMSEAPGDLSQLKHVAAVVVEDLYLLMGKELETVDQVPAGNILGIGGLQAQVLKSATVSSTIACPAFSPVYLDAAPIVRVAVEPKHAGDMSALMQGLRLLNQADPSVEVLVQESGEHVLVTAGEVHLQRCLDDLTQRFAKIELNVSDPMVPFRETIIPPPKVDMVNEVIDHDTNRITKSGKDATEKKIKWGGSILLQTPNKLCSLKVRAMPLPEDISNLLEDNADLLRTLDRITKSSGDISHHQAERAKVTAETLNRLTELKSTLEAKFAQAGRHYRDAIDQIWAFGPRRNGPNILLNRVAGYQRPSVWDCIDQGEVKSAAQFQHFDHAIGSGFQLATLAGPLCEEPLMGVCFVVEEWTMHGQLPEKRQPKSDDTLTNDSSNAAVSFEEEIQVTRTVEESMSPSHTDTSDTVGVSMSPRSHFLSRVHRLSQGVDEDSQSSGEDSDREAAESDFMDRHGPFTGQLISTMKEACRQAFQKHPQRLMAAMYTCDIQATADVLGKMYAVLGRKNGKVLKEDMNESLSVFSIKAALPVAESFGFAEEIRKRTSGLASPQLVFSHWEVVNSDPFWEPITEEELMHFGEKADSENQGRLYMNSVRRRKGLYVDEKIVEHAEKQRTLTKNK
ncbi:elongation factor-like GTPase 1 [Branchiostoma lanceolatum]|uniref:elongation factor-like GTPase 1 n=1 Tax=Branchiostoma lanceolatum TaxID=7740 RepID=UPI00345288B3